MRGNTNRALVWLVFAFGSASVWGSYSFTYRQVAAGVRAVDRAEWLVLNVEPWLVRNHDVWTVHWPWLAVALAITLALAFTALRFDRKFARSAAAVDDQ